MKNKTLLILGAFALIPMLLSTMVNMIISVAYWLGTPSESMKFYMGQCNNEFVAIMTLLGFVGMSFVITAMTIYFRHADKIDKLDEAIEDYHTAEKEMEKARDKYTAQLISDKNK